MVTSIYIQDYLTFLKSVLLEEGMPVFDEVLYVPRGDPDTMMKYVAKSKIVNANITAKQPFVIIGWDRGPINKIDGQRVNNTIRVVDDETGLIRSRKFIRSMFTLRLHLITNTGMTYENLEEVFQTSLRMRTKIESDISSILELKLTNNETFFINILHGEIQDGGNMEEKGNLFYSSWVVDVTAPVVNMIPSEKVKANKITVRIYNENNELKELTFEK